MDMPSSKLSKKRLASEITEEVKEDIKPRKKLKTIQFSKLNKSVKQLDNIKIIFDSGTPFTQEQIKKIKEYFVKHKNEVKLPRTRNRDDSLRGMSRVKQSYYEAIETELGFALDFSIVKIDNNKLVIIYAGKASIPDSKAATFLGEGSFGKVKLAQSLESGKILAAKISSDDLENLESEENTIKIVQQYFGSLNRHIATSKPDHKYYLVSDFVEGVSLKSFLSKPEISYLEKVEAVLKAFESTKKLHEDFKIIHGDLSFNNILYDPVTKKATIIDFGFAKEANKAGKIKLPFKIDFEPTKVDHYHGPECATGFASYSSDIYSLGKWLEISKEITKNHVLQKLSRRMTLKEPENRPTIDECIKICQDLIKNSNQYLARRK
jgi:uncharacterized protein YnzC (UPF0291/DUF896 family)